MTEPAMRTHPICEHPRLSNTCETCRARAAASDDRTAARTIQVLIDRCSTENDAEEFSSIKSALVSARRALRDNARVWDSIADAIVAKYGVQ